MAVYDQAHRLARNLKDSEEYQNYQQQRQKILGDKKSRDMLLDFQEQEFRLQARQMSGQEVTEEDIKKIANLREIIGLNKKVKEYLEAEYRLRVLLSDLQRIIFGELEMGIDEEEEGEKEKEQKEEEEEKEEEDKKEEEYKKEGEEKEVE